MAHIKLLSGLVRLLLALPTDCQLHPVFHVYQLKRATGAPDVAVAAPPLTMDLE